MTTYAFADAGGGVAVSLAAPSAGITFVSSLAAAPGSGGGTTGAFDSTGADAIILSVSAYSSGPAVAVSDNKSNTYTALTMYTASFDTQRIFYCLGATTGTGHTITLTGVPSFAVVCAFAFAGVVAYDSQENGLNNWTASPLPVGSVTPSANGALLVTGMASDQPYTDVAPTSFTGLIGVPFTGGNNFQGSAAYYVQPTAAAINPNWTWIGSGKNATASVAVFTG